MLLGYARVSQSDQNLDLQTDALTAAGCKRVFVDRMSGVRTDRPGLAEALAFARDGDVLAVWRLDRLGRSLAHLIDTITSLNTKGIGYRRSSVFVLRDQILPYTEIYLGKDPAQTHQFHGFAIGIQFRVNY